MSNFIPMPRAGGAPPVTPGPYALATLAQVKADMAIEDGNFDAVLARDIDDATAIIQTVCKGRNFVARDYRERFDRPLSRILLLRQYPVLSVTRLVRGRAAALSIKCTTAGAIAASAAVYNDYSSADSGGLKLLKINAAGVRDGADLAFEQSASTLALADAVNGLSGWSATLAVNVPCSDLLPIVAGNALVGSTLDYPSVVDGRYTLDQDNGRLEMAGEIPVGYRNRDGGYADRVKFADVLVEYRAGYEAVPDDVNQVCRELARRLYYNRRTDPSLQTYTLGPYSVAFSRQAAEDYARLQLGHYIDRSRMV